MRTPATPPILVLRPPPFPYELVLLWTGAHGVLVEAVSPVVNVAVGSGPGWLLLVVVHIDVSGGVLPPLLLLV